MPAGISERQWGFLCCRRLASRLEHEGMQHVRWVQHPPQTQRKVEHWHQTLKSRILLDNYYLPGDFDRRIGAFAEHYDHIRDHEGIEHVAPAEVYFGGAKTTVAERRCITLATIANRRLPHQIRAA